MDNKYSSALLEKAVGELAKLPGVGRKTALRLALHLMRQDEQTTDALSNALYTMRHEVKRCARCHNISDDDLCEICRDQRRDQKTICVVENVQDVLAVENTGQFTGLYHVLGGLISPIDGIGPGQLEIESLVKRAEEEELKEIILAISSTMEGDTTAFYISRKLAHTGVPLSVISRGIPIGDEIEYTDELTLGRSILNRTPFK